MRPITCSYGAALLKMGASVKERPGDIGERGIGIGLEEIGKPMAAFLQRLPVPGGENQQMLAFRIACLRIHRLNEGRLLQYHMGIGAADTERVYSRAARSRSGWPWCQLAADLERACGEIDGRVWLFEAERWRDLAIFKRERGLDQADDAGCGIEMADIGLDRADVRSEERRV